METISNIKTHAQVYQDAFVFSLIGDDGYFLDIGAGWDCYSVNSNSVLLEENGWNGICIEGDLESSNRRKSLSLRANIVNKYIPETTILSILKDFNAPSIIDYVSIDIEPLSIIGLKNFPFDKYKFKVMTFEHDMYRLGIEQKSLSQEILSNFGYVCLCDNVRTPEAFGIDSYFEDWWVNPEYFSEEFILKNTFSNVDGKYIVENMKK